MHIKKGLDTFNIVSINCMPSIAFQIKREIINKTKKT